MTVQNRIFLQSDSLPIDLISDSPAISGRSGFYRDSAKRMIDIVLVLLSAPIVLPAIIILAALVAFDGRNTFYRQQRVGKGGGTFTMWKLRTMVHNADAKLAQHLDSNPAARKEWDEKQKLSNDPRITPLGRVMRKCSMDELPQLWNVLTGDMSLIGPRPMLPEQRAMYPGRAYYNLRPGISGFWQVSDRNDSSFAARAEHDNRYEKELSFMTDLRVIGCTVLVVLRGTGC